MIDFKKILSKKNKEESLDDIPTRKERLKKNGIHLILFFIFLVVFLFFAKNTDTSNNLDSNLVNKVLENEKIQELYNEYSESALLENSTETITQYIDTSTDLNCYISEFLNDTTLVAIVDNEEVLIDLVGIRQFEYANRSMAHINFVNSLYNKPISIIYEDENESDSSKDTVSAYVILSDGQNLNKVLLERGYVFIDTENKNHSYFNEFLIATTQAKENNCGYWAE